MLISDLCWCFIIIVYFLYWVPVAHYETKPLAKSVYKQAPNSLFFPPFFTTIWVCAIVGLLKKPLHFWPIWGPEQGIQSWIAGQATFVQLYLNVIDTDICIIHVSCFMFVECENDCCEYLNQWDPLLESSIKLHWSQFGKIIPQRFFHMFKQVFFEKNCLKLDCIQILFETSAWEFFIILLLLLLLLLLGRDSFSVIK